MADALTEEALEFYRSENVTNVLHIHPKYVEIDDKSFEKSTFPVLGLWAMVLVLAGMIACALFYLSYCCHKRRQKRLATEHHQNFARGEKPETKCASPEEIELGLAVKEWKYAQGSEGSMLTSETMHSVSVEEESSEEEASPTRSDDGISSTTSDISPVLVEAQHNVRLHRLMSQPRCVLCSKLFKEGDQVTMSRNEACKHEYHRECISKWLATKSKNCPVCKNIYVIADAA